MFLVEKGVKMLELVVELLPVERTAPSLLEKGATLSEGVMGFLPVIRTALFPTEKGATRLHLEQVTIIQVGRSNPSRILDMAFWMTKE